MNEPIYVASRASIPARPAMWRALRAEGWSINSSWIDEAGQGETTSYPELWERIGREVAESCGVLLYLEAGDLPLKGALVEVGMALGRGKRVAVVAHGIQLAQRDFAPLGSWAKHPMVRLCETVQDARGWLLGVHQHGPWPQVMAV